MTEPNTDTDPKGKAAADDATPTEATPEATPAEAAPTEATPTEATPAEAAATEDAPTEAAPTEAAPTEPKPTGATPAEAAPADEDHTDNGVAPAVDASDPSDNGVDPAPIDDLDGAPVVELVHPEEPEEPDEIAVLRGQLSDAQTRLRTVSKAYTEQQKEMKAFRERLEGRAKFKEEQLAFQLVKSFFDPVQNLKRSLAAPGNDVDTLADGLRIVHHQFMEALAKLGLEEVPGEGAEFDPNVHEALAVTPVTDAAQDDRVVAVHTDGYTVRGKVLQAAQVVIGKLTEVDGEA